MNYIYKFLDNYVGDTFVLDTRPSGHGNYNIISNNGVKVISFMVQNLNSDDTRVKVFRNDILCQTVGRFFDLGKEESMIVVRDWFGNKLGLKKVSDLLEFIPNEKECVYEKDN